VELRQLEHVLAVVDEGQFTKAAMRVHIAQSGLSASVRALERELGVTLFARTTRRVALTEAGRVFVAEARRVLAAADAARAAVVGVRELDRGTLTVGSVLCAYMWFDLPKLLADFHNRYPGIDLKMRTGDTRALVHQVAEGAFDAVFAGAAMEISPNLQVIPLAVAPFVVACHSDHRLAQRRSVDAELIHEEPFVELSPGSGSRRTTNQMFETLGLERTISFEVQDMRTLLQCVSHGLGIACMPRPPSTSTRNVVFLRLTGQWPLWSLEMVTARSDRAAPAAQALVELVEKQPPPTLKR
jgi:DNA-binding transcriptional LysR family regulator